MDKKTTRLRRALKTRSKIRELAMVRLCVHRTPKHIYAQLISAEGSVLAGVSTLDKAVKSAGYTGNITAAKQVGVLIAKKAQQAGVTKVAFDRSGFKYHGRIKALAESARENGMEF